MTTRPRPRVPFLPTLIACLAAPAVASAQEAANQAGKAETVRLAPKAYRTWDLLLPDERFTDVAAGFLVPHDKGQRFAAKTEGELLRPDLDGDGKLEALVEGEQGFLTLAAKSANRAGVPTG